MRRFITKSLEIFCQIAILIILAVFIHNGAVDGQLGGAVVGFIVGVVVCVILFGAIFLLMDIADNTRRTVELLEDQNL